MSKRPTSRNASSPSRPKFSEATKSSAKNVPSARFAKTGKPTFSHSSRALSPAQQSHSATQANARSIAMPTIAKTDRVAIGFHAINEAIKVRPKQCVSLWIRQGFEASKDLSDLNDLAVNARVKVEIKPNGVLEKFGTNHQGAALIIRGAPELNFEKLGSHKQSQVLFLDGVEDPHNLGAVLRTSWLMGAHGVVVPEDRAVGLSPIVHKVACGGAEHVPVYVDNNFTRLVAPLKEQGYWVFGLSHLGKKSIFDLQLPEKVVWMIGAEDKGLRTNSERICDELVHIPQAAVGASYNASVAAAIALSETFRQHAQQLKRNQ